MKIECLSSIASGALAAVMCMAVVWFVDLEVANRHLEEQRSAVIDKLGTSRAKIEAALNSRLSLVEGMAAFVKSSDEIRDNRPGDFSGEFQAFSGEILKDIEGIRSIQLAPDGVVTFINPLKGNEAALGHDLRADPARRDAVERAIRERKFIVAGPFELRQGGVALIGRLPIFMSSKGEQRESFWGFSMILINMEPLLKMGGLLEQDTGLRYAIRGKDGLGAKGAVFYGEDVLFNANPVVLDVSLPNGSWQIAAVPAEGWGEKTADRINLWVFGTVLAGVVGCLIFVLINRPATLRSALNTLRESEERFRTLIENTNVIAWELDLSTWRFTYVSPHAVGLLGYDLNDWYEEGFWADHIHPEDREKTILFCTKATEWGEDHDFEYRMIAAEGRIVWLRDIVTVVKEGSSPVSLRGFMIDINERKSLEAQLLHAQRMEAVGQLTGGIAHDFNNLLGVMMGNTEMLEDRIGDDEEAKDNIESLIGAVDRAASLTGRLLAFSRQQTLSPRPTAVDGLVLGLENMLHRTLGETIDLRVEGVPNLWPAMIDPHQFENALLNLAVNARDAMPKGGTLVIKTDNVTLDEAYAAQHEELTPGEYVEVGVSDTGTGMPPGVLEKVFEPFFTTKEVGEGSGLGLSMVYGFAKQSKGHVTIDSEVGHGTTVKLYVPRSQEDVAQDDTKGDTPEFALGSERILVVEDDEGMRGISVTIFQDQGYEVVEAGDGKEAIKLLKDGLPFDLLFTDVVLPGGMNGVEIAEEAIRIQPNIKVLYTTGYAENVAPHNRQLEPSVTLINKPYRRSELLEKVRAALDSEEA